MQVCLEVERLINNLGLDVISAVSVLTAEGLPSTALNFKLLRCTRGDSPGSRNWCFYGDVYVTGNAMWEETFQLPFLNEVTISPFKCVVR